MYLDYPWYEAPIVRIADLLWITETDQVIGNVLIFVLDGVVEPSNHKV